MPCAKKRRRMQPPSQNPIGGGATVKRADGIGYTWTQDISSLMICFRLQDGTSAKMIKVKFSSDSCSITVLSQFSIHVSFCKSVKVSECEWQLEDRKELILHVAKEVGDWWDCAFIGDTCINTSKIDAPSVYYSQLPSEMQYSVQQMLEKQKKEEESWNVDVAKLQKLHPNVDFSKFDFSEAKFNIQ